MECFSPCIFNCAIHSEWISVGLSGDNKNIIRVFLLLLGFTTLFNNLGHGCANSATEGKRFSSPIHCCDVTKPLYLFSGELCTSPLHSKRLFVYTVCCRRGGQCFAVLRTRNQTSYWRSGWQYTLAHPWSNPSVALPTSKLILQPFRCFTYVSCRAANALGEVNDSKIKKITYLGYKFERKSVSRARVRKNGTLCHCSVTWLLPLLSPTTSVWRLFYVFW